MTDDFARLLPAARTAVDLAARLMRQHRPDTVTMKGDRDPASDVDFAIERQVRAYLATQTPSIAFLGEEEGHSGSAADEYLWALDPVDGTVNFVHDLPLCAVSLGLLFRGRPVLGVIRTPFLGAEYWAVEGQGSWSQDQRLRVSNTPTLQQALVSIGDYAVGTEAERKNSRRLALTARLAAGAERVRMLGSAAIDLAWMAQGRLDACVMLSNHPWDTAAGVILAREAGADVLDEDGSEHSAKSRATLAVTPALRADVLELLRNLDVPAPGPAPTPSG